MNDRLDTPTAPLVIVYARVSTEEQAEEGYSIEGQAERATAYAAARGWRNVLVITDPGLSGKNMNRPALQHALRLIERGQVAHFIVWRLDRLSRNVGDLHWLAQHFDTHQVVLHSVTEAIDLSSPTGRMFYNILGTFAQFFREQLAENVRLGQNQARRQGRWIGKPPRGYDVVDGHLHPNTDAALVRRAFQLRADSASYTAIARQTGIPHGTLCGVMFKSRVYLGHAPCQGDWIPDAHPPLVTMEEWDAAQRPHAPRQRRRGRHALSGRVRCGRCGRRAQIHYVKTGLSTAVYRCETGCKQPRRIAGGLMRAVGLGLRLLSTDKALRDAIRAEVRQIATPSAPTGPTAHATIQDIRRRQQKLLDLYYADKISPDLFAIQETQLAAQLTAAQAALSNEQDAAQDAAHIAQAFDQIVSRLDDLDFQTMWDQGTDHHRQVLVEELVENVTMHPDHLEVKMAGTPALTVLLEEIGLQPTQGSFTPSAYSPKPPTSTLNSQQTLSPWPRQRAQRSTSQVPGSRSNFTWISAPGTSLVSG